MAVPLSYNVRSLYMRRKLTILAVGGIAVVIGVLIVLIAMANGFRVALSATGSPINAIVTQRRALVEVNGDGKLLPDPLAGFMRQRNAFVHRHAAHRHEGQYVSRAGARMLSGVRSQIDQLGCFRHRAQRRIYDNFRCGHKSDHRAVVIGVQVSIENDSAFHRFDRARDLFNRFRLATFAKVWYTLN